MRIGIFTDTYLPDINGVATSSYILCHALRKHGHEVFVVTTELPEDSEYEDDENVLRLPGIEIKKMYGYRASNIFSFKGMKEIKNFGLDLIHIQTEFGIGIFGKIAAQILNIPVVYTYHTMYEDYSHYIAGSFSPVNSIVKKAVETISRIYGDNCTELVVPSEKTKEVLENYGIEKDIHIVPTGLMLDAFKIENKNEQKIHEIREKYNINNQFVITFVGRLAKEKSVDLLLQGIRHLVDQNVNVLFLVVGKGPALDELKELSTKLDIDNYVEFVGPIPSNEIPSYYHLADVFASASITETQGLTFIEAQAASTVVLARHDKNLEDVIIDGYNGFYFSDAIDFANKIKQLMTMDLDPIRQQAACDAREYSDDIFYERIYKVYQLAIEHLHYSYKVLHIFPLKNKMYECVFKSDENEISLHLAESILNKFGLYKGKIIERDEFDALSDYEKVYDAYNRALKFLTIKDYTKAQMIEKLNKLDLFDDIQIDMAINALIKKNLINDEEYAKDYFIRASKLGLGMNKAIAALRSRGVEDDIIEQTREHYSEENEYQTALEFVEKTYDKNAKKSRKAMINSIAEKLYVKGFSSPVINKVMSNFDFYSNDELENELIYKEFNKAFKRYGAKYEGKVLYNKIYTYLMRKGFDYTLIKEVMKENGYSEN